MGWQDKIKQNIVTIDELKQYIKLSKQEEKLLKKVADFHPMSITKYYLSLINKQDKNDPIKKLIIPSVEELNQEGSYDPSDEKSNTKQVGLQHKYKQTALILCTNECTAYCRHCFRKRMVGLSNKERLKRFDLAVSYIKKHKEIDNVLITGGDSLALETHVIEKFLNKLSTIPHVKYIRFGTRVPVVFPDRILDDKRLLQVMKKYSKKKQIHIVTHFNHPREITKKSIAGIKKILDANILIYNQTVLLRGINDNPKLLASLLNQLIDIGILPYYVFQCRPVKRVKEHFSVPLYKGYQIFEAAKKKIKAHILCKRLKYIMSHKTGKVEMIGVLDDEIYFKYHQAKNPNNLGKFFKRKLNKTAAWLDELKK